MELGACCLAGYRAQAKGRGQLTEPLGENCANVVKNGECCIVALIELVQLPISPQSPVSTSSRPLRQPQSKTQAGSRLFQIPPLAPAWPVNVHAQSQRLLAVAGLASSLPQVFLSVTRLNAKRTSFLTSVTPSLLSRRPSSQNPLDSLGSTPPKRLLIPVALQG